MSHRWIDPQDEILYTVTPEAAVLSGGLEAELRPRDQALAAPLAREILRLAKENEQLKSLIEYIFPLLKIARWNDAARMAEDLLGLVIRKHVTPPAQEDEEPAGTSPPAARD